MRSSTSSSEALGARELAAEGRLVSGGWVPVLAIAVLLTTLVLGWWEARLRSEDVQPSVSSTEASWSVVRDRLAPDSIVLLGTSKMQSAVDPETLGRTLDHRPVLQLALVDSSPLPILEQLVSQEWFRGTVIMDVAPRIFFDTELRSEVGTRSVLDAYREYRTSPGERVDARLGIAVESSLSLRRPEYSIRQMTRAWFGTGLLGVQGTPARVRRDRFREIDFSKTELETFRSMQALLTATAGEAARGADLESTLDRTAAAARSLSDRGGELIPILLPLSGEARTYEQDRYPRAGYWDRLVERTGTQGIHFADHVALASFDCPDDVHLGAEQAQEFTLALADLLMARGTVSRHAPTQ